MEELSAVGDADAGLFAPPATVTGDDNPAAEAGRSSGVDDSGGDSSSKESFGRTLEPNTRDFVVGAEVGEGLCRGGHPRL